MEPTILWIVKKKLYLNTLKMNDFTSYSFVQEPFKSVPLILRADLRFQVKGGQSIKRKEKSK